LISKESSELPRELQASNAIGSDILVRELPRHAWPKKFDATVFGAPHRYNKLYRSLSYFFQKIRPEYEFKHFHPTTSGDRVNSISEYHNIVNTLEDIFREELGASYTPEQRQLLLTSEIVILIVDRKTKSIVGYSSGTKVQPSPVSFSFPVVFGGHAIIRHDHQQAKIGLITAALLLVYAQPLSNLFSRIGFIVRSNNKHILRPMEQCGEIFRSDQMHQYETDVSEQKKIFLHMHNEVFGLKNTELPFDAPLNISHYFEEDVRISGLGGNQIIYVLCVTTLFTTVCKLIFRRRRRKNRDV